MAKRIGLCEVGQDQASTYLKASVARRLIRRGFAEWLVINRIVRRLQTRRLPEREVLVLVTRSYIPDILPAAELPGLTFEPPTGTAPSTAPFLIKAARIFCENATASAS